MRYFIIAGEASGDLHGSNLMRSLRDHDPVADFLCFGGDLMASQGGRLLKHYRDMAFMGAIDVVMNMGKIRENFRLCRQQLLESKPDVLILIDYPGFNLKMAEFAAQNDIPVFYYILPKVWAWKAWRIKKLKKFVTGMFSIFPFEASFFRKYGAEVKFVGNPLLDAVKEVESAPYDILGFREQNNLSGKPVVALLPGSRAQEIRLMLPVMTRLPADFQEFDFVICGTGAVNPELYQKYSSDLSVPVLLDKTYEILKYSHSAIVTSGTATLETALFRVPQIVLYKMAGGKLGYRIFRKLFLKVTLFSLPNLILGKATLKEFIMDQMSYDLVKPEAGKLLMDPEYRKRILDGYARLEGLMGESGASSRAAIEMMGLLKSIKANRKNKL
ncbi:MAG TPA: lipid-A-disaccharide synthase [Prolixibacteraceae bacterium]|nr:lipid-A-disaccharide synthase [Prolixibacteraceae bacterium]